jgi:creatinine amidohydrolase/Fe(II)-dependent formamide hydrolase-like protein
MPAADRHLRAHGRPACPRLGGAASHRLPDHLYETRIQENFDISALPEDAMRQILDRIATNARFNAVVQTGVPGFISRAPVNPIHQHGGAGVNLATSAFGSQVERQRGRRRPTGFSVCS